MFADIEGYTALFQKNEGEAFNLVEQHREDLQQISIKHNGQVVKYYGDGSLTLFNSVIDATKCAIELQEVSVRHSVPLRIGIHMGEMIEKNDDVYGDAVNVASRIQAIGTKGSILVSRTVIDELKNHPAIVSKSLGTVDLKNVKDPVEVFAIVSHGLSIPQVLPGSRKKYRNRIYYMVGAVLMVVIAGFLFKDVLKSKYIQLGEDCIIIPPFKAYVTNPQLENSNLGDLAASILSKAMSESAKVDIINYTSALLYTNVNLASISDNPIGARRMGAKFMIQGNYALEGIKQDSLRFWMQIVDLNTNQNLPFTIPEVHCKAADYMGCIDNVCNIMAGYWKSKKDYLFQFANDSAYLAFLSAQKKWADRKYDDQTKAYLIKAITYDPKFLDAWFLMLDYFHNHKLYKEGRDTIRLIESRFPSLDQRQQDYLAYYKNDFNGKNVLAFKSCLKELNQNKKDLFVNTTAMVMAMEYLNDPATTIHIFNLIDNDSIDLGTCSYCIVRSNIALNAFVDLPNLEKAGELAARIRPFARETTHFIDLIEYYIKIKDTTSVNDIIQMAVNREGSQADEEPYLCLMTARMAAVNGDVSLTNRYARRAIQYKGENSKSTVARAQMLIGDLEAAKKNFLASVASNPDANTYANLGVISARQGDKVKANEMIQKLSDLKAENDFGKTLYQQGKIKANLGEYDEAIKYLNSSLDAGYRFIIAYSFQQDPELMVLNSNPQYQAMLVKNRQPQ